MKTSTMSKAELARQLGVSRTYITLLIQGKRKPSKELANKLAKLKLTVDIKCNQQIGGPLAQLAEHLTFNQGVTGSRPVRPTRNI
jgi:transcriptional regulator with XRE-family HTH domain